ncbi:MAG: calcium-translocating P-type ATPase, PMCA-type [Clostridia bacterium]|nr:calcium-translocating P-type ATPase, PMCA-type [Clostridia bacterium]
MKVYQKDTSEVLSELKSSPEGLSSREAQERLERNGKNRLEQGKKEGVVKKFLKQMADPMIIILLVAAGLSAVTSIYAHESPADVFIILFVVVLNSILGVVQESKAEQALEALKEMTAATSKVLRDGKIEIVKSEDLVAGDVIVLEAGDSVPADCRVLESASLKIEEAALTGESVAVSKIAEKLESDKPIPLGDRKNMIFMGSTVVYGRGRAVVCGTGMQTEMGKIASALTMAKEEKTPLQKKLAGLSKILTWLVIGISVLVFVFGLIRAGKFDVSVVLDTFMLAVSLAVAAIPEGLVAVVTIVLSIGVTKMSKQAAVIRKLTAVETLGCAQVICSDKTGTLTQNKMTVVESFGPDEVLLGRGMALCSDAEIEDGVVKGEPTEAALVAFADKLGENKGAIKKTYPRVGEAPFDSMRKMMSTVHKDGEGYIQFTKGAPDVVLDRCTTYLTPDGIQPMTEEIRQSFLDKNKEMADRALRVLALAQRQYRSQPADYEAENLEQDLTFVGLCGMIDPVRPEVKAAVEKCHAAGIRVVMITGDHIDTAVAIAKELDILQDASQAIAGYEMDAWSDEELDARVPHISVYARVQPEHKVRIVSSWKRLGMVTAMTGDGVNDAPSIKTADIGVGMGITGTDVTKNVADMILADDNFSTIVRAVEEGRKIYDNIRKTIAFLLSSNMSEVISIFTATMIGFTVLKPVHLLWINLITDSLPALALGMEYGEKDIMERKPRDSKEGIFANGVGFDILYQGVLIALLTLAAYLLGHFMENGEWTFTDSRDGMTMAFLTLSMSELFHALNMRSNRKSLFTMKKQNLFLWGACLAALALTSAVIYIPALRNLFDFASIDAREYFSALGLAAAIIPVVEIVKLVERIVEKKKEKGKKND